MAVERGFRSGVIEGFYGRPWSEAQRLALFERMRGWSLTTYLYAPKDDLKHRARWRTPYDAAEEAALARLVEGARRRDVSFAYALAPGLDLRFAAPEDAAALHDKVEQVLRLGARTVALLFDDVPRALSSEDEARYGTLAAAQADAANRLHAQLRAAGGEALLFCPTDYCSAMARPSLAESPYLRELGERLEPAVEVLWTGPEVISETIDVDHVREVAAALGRKPVLWDNLHANDYDLRRVFLGPYAGRPAELRSEVRGILANPNVECAANVVPLATLAAYLRDDGYEPRAAFLEATAAWAAELHNASGTTVASEDLAFLADFHYLPFEDGPAARAFLDDVAYLAASPPPAWGETFGAVAGAVLRLARLAEGMAGLADRELAAGLAPYVRDLLAEAAWAAQRLDRRRRGGASDAPRDGIGAAFDRGFVNELRRLLAAERDAGRP